MNNVNTGNNIAAASEAIDTILVKAIKTIPNTKQINPICQFVNNNIPRYAGIRGTTSKRFMYEAYCSDKAYSFKINSIYKRNSVHLFESAIDLLSYATLKELNNELFNEENLLSLAGVYRPAKIITDSKTPEALSAYLKNNPNIDTIIMHLDNDETGRLATKAIQFSLPDSYKIIDNPPKIGKDYNDYLCIILGKTNNKNYDYYR